MQGFYTHKRRQDALISLILANMLISSSRHNITDLNRYGNIILHTIVQMPQTVHKKNKPGNILIDDEHCGRRIDNFLIAFFKRMPRSRVYQMLRRGEVRVNGSRIKPDYRLQTGDDIRLPPVFEQRSGAPDSAPARLVDMIGKCILHQDERIIVINKPAGLPAHAGTGSYFGVIELLRELFDKEDGLNLVHRLDKETSGCLMIARNMPALRQLNQALKAGAVRKEYEALLQGRLRQKLTRVDSPLRRYGNRAGQGKVRPDEEGKTALSEFTVLTLFGDATRVKVNTGTGRTHQIRAHAGAIGHPLAGDDKYGDREFNRTMRSLGLKRMFLHAGKLTVPALKDTGKYRFSAPLPAELKTVLKRLT